MGHRIRGPFQRSFSLSCCLQVYFLRKSTKFHGMREKFQILGLIIHFLMYFRSSLISRSSITQKFLPDISPIAPRSSEAVLSNFLLASYAKNLKPPSNIASPVPVTSSVN